MANKTNVRTEEAVNKPASSSRRILSKPAASDVVFFGVARSAGVITVLVMLAVGIFLATRGTDAIASQKFGFLTTTEWSPESRHFGIAAVLAGTVIIALVALTVSFPLAFGTSLLISEVLPNRYKSAVISLIDLMSAVPSVIYGLWGFYFLQTAIIPVSQWISTYLGWIPFLAVVSADGTPSTDPNLFTSSSFIAGIVVGFMVVPTQTSIMREAFSQAPVGEREGALALGSTRWGMIRSVVLPFGKGGIIGGTMLGLGRALGETIAVVIIISPVFTINWHVISSGTNSVSALIALRYGEADDFALSALMAAGLVLFLITLVINFTASTIVAKSRSGAES